MLVQKSPRQALLILLISTLTLAACNVGATPAPTIDTNAINTAAFTTAMAQISAQQTQTALAAPSATPLQTNTPLALSTLVLPTNATAASPAAGTGGLLPTVSFNTTPLPGSTPFATSLPPTASGQVSTAAGCSDGVLVGETLPDKSEVTAGKDFSKAWEMKNTGTCDWDEGFVFAFQSDLSSGGIEGYDISIKTSDRVTKPNHTQSFIVKLTAPTTPGEYKGYWRLKDDAGNYFGSLVFFDIIVK